MNRATPTFLWVGLTLSTFGCTQDVPPPANIVSQTKTIGPVEEPAFKQVEQQVDVARSTAAELVMPPVQVTLHQEPAIERDSEPAPEASLDIISTAEVVPRQPHDFNNLIEPFVKLSEEHEQTCLVTTGDSFPPLTVITVSGDEDALSNHYGDRLTVVVFWTNNHPYAREQYRHLENEIYEPYGPDGVGLVAINVGDPIEEVRQQVGQHGSEFQNFVDPDRVAFHKVASMKLPRTYLLDSSGRVLWFDIEYSRSTRRDLDRAIRFFLSGQSG